MGERPITTLKEETHHALPSLHPPPDHPQAHEDETRLNEFLQSVRVHTIQTTAGAPGCWSVLVFYEEPQSAVRGVKGGKVAQAPADAAPEEADLTPAEQRVYDRLRVWRSERAAAEGKPPYIIAHNTALRFIARHHMSLQVADDLASIRQFGPARAARYGPELIGLLRQPAVEDEAELFQEA